MSGSVQQLASVLGEIEGRFPEELLAIMHLDIPEGNTAPADSSEHAQGAIASSKLLSDQTAFQHAGDNEVVADVQLSLTAATNQPGDASGENSDADANADADADADADLEDTEAAADTVELQRYCYEVLQQRHPGQRISEKSMHILVGLLEHVTEKVITQAHEQAQNSGGVLSSQEIQQAVRSVLPPPSEGELEGSKLIRPFLPGVYKRARHLDKQSLPRRRRKKEPETSSAPNGES